MSRRPSLSSQPPIMPNRTSSQLPPASIAHPSLKTKRPPAFYAPTSVFLPLIRSHFNILLGTTCASTRTHSARLRFGEQTGPRVD